MSELAAATSELVPGSWYILSGWLSEVCLAGSVWPGSLVWSASLSGTSVTSYARFCATLQSADVDCLLLRLEKEEKILEFYDLSALYRLLKTL